MANSNAIERLEYLIEHYMETRSKPTIISTAKVARALTTLMTVSPLLDRDLEDASPKPPCVTGTSSSSIFPSRKTTGPNSPQWR